MTAAERRKRLRDYIDMHGEATLKEIQEICGGCSSMTLWRDLKQFEEEGYIMRLRGGVVAVNHVQAKTEGLYSIRANTNRAAKNIIAKKALELISPDTSIFMDSGSTVMAWPTASKQTLYYCDQRCQHIHKAVSKQPL